MSGLARFFLELIEKILRRLLAIIRVNSTEISYIGEETTTNLFRIIELETEPRSLNFTDPKSNQEIFRGLAARYHVEICNGVVHLQTGAIYLDNKKFFAESLAWPPELQLLTKPLGFSKIGVRYLHGEYLILPSTPYFHFLGEDLPALLGALTKNPLTTVLVAKRSPSYVYDALNILGIKYLEVDNKIVVQRLRLISKTQSTGWVQPYDLDLLQKFQRNVKVNSEFRNIKKAYISRRRSSRSLINEIEIELALESHGFTILYLEDFSLSDQISLFSSLEIIISPHGAGLTNIVWSKKGLIVIELLSLNYYNGCYAALSTLCEHKYAAIFDESNNPFRFQIDKILEVFNPK